jgi:hypothetical protein
VPGGRFWLFHRRLSAVVRLTLKDCMQLITSPHVDTILLPINLVPSRLLFLVVTCCGAKNVTGFDPRRGEPK